MKSALIRLRESKNSISATEQTIAEYVLNNPENISELTVHQLASKSFSSAATVVRLCRRIGFNGYKDFKNSIIYEITLKKLSEKKEQQEITRSDSIDDIIDKVTYRNILSLEDTKNLLDAETLENCLKLIKSSRNIILFGMGASLIVAKDAYLKFLRLNKPCIINEDWHSQYLQARNSTSEDLAIVISYSGETLEVIECMKALTQNNTPIIAITRCVPSPISDLADYKIFTAAIESTFRSGAMSSRISQLNIIDILYTAYANSEYEYSLSQLSKTHIRKIGK